MDYVWIGISILIVISCMYFIGSPFLATDKGPSSRDRTDQHGQKSRIYQSLNELEIDYLMKKLSDEDYQEIQKSLKQTLMQELKKDEQSLPGPHLNLEGDSKELEDELRNQLVDLRKNR